MLIIGSLCIIFSMTLSTLFVTGKTLKRRYLYIYHLHNLIVIISGHRSHLSFESHRRLRILFLRRGILLPDLAYAASSCTPSCLILIFVLLQVEIGIFLQVIIGLLINIRWAIGWKLTDVYASLVAVPTIKLIFCHY